MSSKYFIGVDIGGSSVKAALVDPVRNGVSNGASKKIIESLVEDSPDNLEKLLSLVTKMKEDLVSDIDASEIGGIGFALAGVMDLKREQVLSAPNIRYLENPQIKKLLEEELAPYPVKLEHDVVCFLLAEKEIGLAKNLKNVFYLTLGTGIGGAYMIDGKIIKGSHGAAGEAGHMIVDVVRLLDLEELAANKFIRKQLGFGSAEAEKRARAGDKKVQKVLGQLGKNLGVGLANIINIFDPEAVILGGGIAQQAGEFIFPGIREGIEKFVISPAAKETPVLFSRLGRFGGALGAALLFD